MSDDIRENIKELFDLLLRKGLTLSLAESCTGGKVASLMTDIPGASEVFKGCAVTYSNDSKERMLNVSRATLISNGAVSAEAAKEMAGGARTVFGTDIAASATGIAGPEGGTDAKPVGTVFIAVADGNGTECRQLVLKGSRDDVRDGTSRAVIRMLIDSVKKM